MSTTNYKKQIKSIVEGIKIESMSTYFVSGASKYVKNQMPYFNFSGDLNSFGSNTSVDENQQKQNLTNSLINSIYTTFYCGISQDYNPSDLPSKVDRNNFMEKLSKANKTKEGLDYNWTIYNIDPSGNAFVKKDEELRWLQPDSYTFQNPTQKQPIVNTKVNLTKTRESKTTQPVFYHVFSDEMFPQESELSRIYWNINSKGIEKLVDLITSTFNSYRVPFQFKCLNHPDLYVRSDSAVLYIDKRYVSITLTLLKPIIKTLEPFLVDEVPMFTKQLFKGVSYAEDPGKGMSFGMSRSTVIAEALVTSHMKGETGKEAIKSVYNALASKGISIEKMHLNNHTKLTPNFPKYE